MSPYLSSLAGGALIGLSAALLLIVSGRIAGISGIVGGVFRRPDAQVVTNLAFVLGLLLGPVLFLVIFKAWPAVRIDASLPVLVAAGLLVGFGTRLGSGCTSGHGVMGLARLSPRSIAATVMFLGMAVVTVFLMRLGGLT